MMKTKSKLYASLAGLVIFMISGLAEAHVTRVWYDIRNEPVGFARTPLLMSIQSAMREWEYHGRGQIAMKWEGITFNKAGGGSDDLIIGWDPTLVGTGTCAQTWTYTAFQAQPMGRLDLNPAIMGSAAVYSGTPVLGNGCLVGRAVLIHEMAHWFRWEFNHPTDSVLGSTCAGGICSDFMALSLWNGDMDGINQNNWFPVFAPTYPPLGVLLLTDIYNTSNGTVVSGGGTGLSGSTDIGAPGPQNFTGSLGVGGPGFSYARAYTDFNTLVVDQGTGTVPWTNRRIIADFTRRQTCITGTSNSSDMYVAWASNAQVATANVPNVGARSVRFSESHDGGNTWSSPLDIPWSSTRTGVSCGFDVARNQVVVAWADSVSLAVKYSERLPSAVGAAGWIFPRTIAGPLTYELPMLVFDPFTAGSGFLTWHSIPNAGAPFISRVFHNGTSYALNVPQGINPVDFPEGNELRTNIIPNPFGSEMHYAYGRNSGPPSSQVRVRRGNTWSVLSSDSVTESASFEPSLDRYTGSANDRIFYSSAYLHHSIHPH